MQILELQLKDDNYDPSLHRLLEEVVEKVENPGLLSKDVVPVCNPITQPHAPKDKRPWREFHWSVISETLQTGLDPKVNEPEYNDFNIRESQLLPPPWRQPTASELEGNNQELRSQVVILDTGSAIPMTPEWKEKSATPTSPDLMYAIPRTPPYPPPLDPPPNPPPFTFQPPPPLPPPPPPLLHRPQLC